MSSSWSNLSSQDKQAFYSILDEYFTSRPHLFPQPHNNPNSTTTNSSSNAYSAASSIASTHPGVAASALRAAGVPKNVASSNNVSTVSKWSQNPKVVAASSKVSQLAGKWNPNGQSNSEQDSTSTDHMTNESQVSSHTSRKPGTLPNGLQSSQKFMGGFVSQAEKDALKRNPSGVLGSSQPQSQKKPTFDPPPIRKTGPIPIPTPSLIETEPQEEEDDQEWVVALYDFEGSSDQDLSFKVHQVIKVTEHISDDWWNGQIDNGPIGMFPKTYVKPL
ncbi:uncharacterized protein MELLADRAFT_92433 [Melampsora larici-populina 98AG31]|uniref:SH3 domain-containing protein n=1 Tax=Melampsora larici-populina (strain 98AG31 / pathotype 3-4-7) TaxID=747676 RepID=F4R9M8_MELLP|nr:uncharacterized protein MELLADRAFT_92433 [Melampsora larici-populina 98AG31]EGG11008.1 hypothetical protein MELLADRAFT_92433 [Melampsora larici-populina 98AG31]